MEFIAISLASQEALYLRPLLRTMMEFELLKNPTTHHLIHLSKLGQHVIWKCCLHWRYSSSLCYSIYGLIILFHVHITTCLYAALKYILILMLHFSSMAGKTSEQNDVPLSIITSSTSSHSRITFKPLSLLTTPFTVPATQVYSQP